MGAFAVASVGRNGVNRIRRGGVLRSTVGKCRPSAVCRGRLLAARLILVWALSLTFGPGVAFGNSGAWSAPVQVDGTNFLQSVSCTSSSLCVAGDQHGNVVASTNPTGGAGAWSPAANVDGSDSLDAVSCPSASLCVAVSTFGNLVTSTNPTGGAAAWSAPVNFDLTGGGTNVPDSVSCPSVSLCIVVDFSGNVLASSAPTGGAGAWNPVGRIDNGGGLV